MNEARRELHSFLISAFSASELRRFVALLPGEIDQVVSWSAPLEVTVEQVIDALVRRGLIEELLMELQRERPGRARDVEKLHRRLWTEDRRGEPASVFISYATANRETAGALAAALRARGVGTFVAHEDIRPGDRWDERISQEIDRAVVVVALGHRGGARSSWVSVELSRAIERARRGKLRIIPVFIDGIPHPNETPPGLADFQWLDLHTVGLEGAADAIAPIAKNPEATLPTRPTSEPTRISDGDLVLSFFVSAGRTPENTGHDRLRVPEPVYIAKDTSYATSLSFALQEELAGTTSSGFLIVLEGWSPELNRRILECRLNGAAIVPLTRREIRVALEDGKSAALLRDKEAEARGGDNLFRRRNAEYDERFVFGRVDLLARLGSLLGRGEHTLLCGTRKSGKTSVLNVLRQALSDTGPVAAIDLQLLDPEDPTWPEDLFGRILTAFDRWGVGSWPDWPASSAGPISTAVFASGLADRRRWHLERTGGHRHAPPLVVILDELERMMPASAEGTRRFVRAMGALRAAGQGADRQLALIAADLRPTANRLNELPGGETSPLFQFFQEIALPLLTTSSIGEMITGIGLRMHITHVSAPFSARVHELSGGHPFVARSIVAEAAENRTDPHGLDLPDLERGLQTLDDRWILGSFFEENFWKPLSADEQQVLLAVTTRRRPPAGPARASLGLQSLLVDGQIPIGTFASWLRETHAPPLAADPSGSTGP